ncbi:inositol monophosphatase [Candidatus Woesearchaeota archaeon]|nr:inositol monophosphatase [Candidatus Woesearchaeota archaeon]
MKELDIAKKAAREAGEILLHHFRKPLHIRYKEHSSPVTAADVGADKKIREIIGRAFPDHLFLSEELGGDASTKPLWVVDPLDGTFNFVRNNPDFCVMIGLQKEGELVLGVIYFPVQNIWFSAEKGKGAFCGSRKIHVSGFHEMKKMVGSTHMTSTFKARRENLKIYDKLLLKVSNIETAASCAGRILMNLAEGLSDFYFRTSIHPWDYAAGTCIIREAGGMVTDLEGRQFGIASKSVLASNAKNHEGLVRMIAKMR